MKQLMKRAFVMMLSASIVFSSVPLQHVHAEEDVIITSENQEELLQEEESEGETSQEENVGEDLLQTASEDDDIALADATSGSWYYNTNNDGTISFTTYLGEDGETVDLVIPDTYDGKTVAGWNYQIFKDKSFKSVTLPTTLTTEASLFGDCGTIKKVIVPSNYTNPYQWFYTAGAIESIEFVNSGITTIPGNAFASSPIQEITGLENVTTVGENAFMNCSKLGELDFSNKLTSVGSQAFSGATNLEWVDLGGSVEEIPMGTFRGCTKLENVIGLENITKVGNSAFNSCTILGNLGLQKLQSLGDSAFYGTAITAIELPGTLTSIGAGAYMNCTSLSDVTIESGITAIPGNMFNGCTSLTSVVLPDSVTSIDYQAFMNCSSLESVTIPASVTTINGYLFFASSQNTIIKGYTGSYAEEYANGKEMTFESIGVIAEETGVFLSNADMITDSEGNIYVLRGTKALNVQAKLGEGVELTGWDFVFVNEGGTETSVGQEHYNYNDSTMELIISDSSDLSTTGTYRVTAYGKDADGEDVSYSEEFKFIEKPFVLNRDFVRLYDDSEVTLSASSIYGEEASVKYYWEAGAFNDNGNFEADVQFNTTGDSITLTKNVLAAAWGENPKTGAETDIHVCIEVDGTVVNDLIVDVVYCEGSKNDRGLFLRNADMLNDSEDTINVYRGNKALHVQAVLGEDVEHTGWDFVFINEDGKEISVGQEHYIYHDPTMELIIPESSDLSTTGTYRVTVYGKDSCGDEISYSVDFKFIGKTFILSHDEILLYDGSEVTLSASSIYDEEASVEYYWEAGAFNDNGYFEADVQFDTTEDSITLTKGALTAAWGSAPEDGTKTSIHVCLKNGDFIEDRTITVVYKADFLEFPMEDFTELKDWSSWISESQQMYVVNAEYPDGEYVPITIKSVTSDTMTIPLEDGGYKFAYENATADSGKIRFTYILDDENTETERTHEISYEFKDVLYHLETIDVGTPALVKGQSNNIRPILHKQWVEEEDGFYNTYGEPVAIKGTLTVQWTYDETEAAKYVTIKKNSDGSIDVTSVAGVDSEVFIPLTLTVKDGEEIIASYVKEILLLSSYDEFFVYDVSTGKIFEDENIELGETRTIRPAWMSFTNSTPNGTNLGVEFTATVTDYSKGFDVTDNNDGTYTIKRVNREPLEIEFKGQLSDFDIEECFYLSNLDVSMEYYASEEDEDILLFDNDKIKVTAIAENVSEHVVWDWDFVVYGGFGSSTDDELYRVDIASGNNLRSVELDGSKYAQYLEDANADDFKFEVKLYVNEEPAYTDGRYFEYKKSHVEEPFENVWDGLISTGGEIDKSYMGWVETKDYPHGIAAQLDIKNLQVVSGSNVISLVDANDHYDVTILEEGTAVINYDIYYQNKLLKEAVTLTINGSKAVYEGNIVSDKAEDGGAYIFENETITFRADYYLDCYSEEGYFYKENVEDLKLVVVDSYFDCDEDGCEDNCTAARLIENADGTVTFAPNNHHCELQVKMDVYAGNAKIDTWTEWVITTTLKYEIVIENEDTIKNLKSGESVDVIPVLKEYRPDAPEGVTLNPSEMNLNFIWEYDETDFEITSKETNDVTVWTIKRLNSYEVILYGGYADLRYDEYIAGWLTMFECAHANTKFVNGKASTCLEAGYSGAKVCEACDYLVSKSSALDKLPHTMTHHEAKEATCLATGNLEYWACSACGNNYDAEADGNLITDVVVAKKSHDMTYHEAKEATCLAAGNVEYWACSACDYDYDAAADGKVITDVVVAKKSHTMTHHAELTPTCTETGNVEYWACSSCGYNYDAAVEGNVLDQVVINENPHGLVHFAPEDATCTEAGNIEYYRCEDCGALFADKIAQQPITSSVVIPAKGHQMIYHVAVAAGCKTAGKSAHYHCDICGKDFADAEGAKESSNVVISATGHKMTKYAAKAATCEKDGNVEYYACIYCNQNYEDVAGNSVLNNVKISHTGHTWGADATCTTAKVCTVCDKVSEAAKGHQMRLVESNVQSCTNNGNVKYYHCDTCNLNFADEEGTQELLNVTTEATSHKLSKVEAAAVSCTADGVIAHYHCSACDKNFTDQAAAIEITQNVVIESQGHQMTKTEAKAKTCTEDGNVEYYTCSVCDKHFADAAGSEELAADKLKLKADHGILKRTKAVAATCSADGNREYYTCSDCGKHYTDRTARTELSAADLVIKAKHGTMKFTAAVPATCKEAGNVAYYTCSECKKNYADEMGITALTAVTVPATGHQMTKQESTAASCDGNGNVAYYHCDTCNKNYSDAAGNYELFTTEISASGHKLSLVEANPATCTVDGNVKYYHCDTCGKNFQDKECTRILSTLIAPALGHRIGATQTQAVEATCTTTGTKAHYTCNTCGTHFADVAGREKLDSIVTPIKHQLTYVEAKEPTADASGNAAHYVCSVESCGMKFADADGLKAVENVTLPKLVSIKSEPLTAVPENLNKDAMDSEGFRHVDEIKEEIVGKTEEELKVSENEKIETTHYEFTLDADAEMPADQMITIFWAYEDIASGVGKDTEFVVAHMYKTCDAEGNETTDIEFPEVHNDEDGIWFVVHGLSPISVSWIEPVSSGGSSSGGSSSGGSSSSGSSSNSSKEDDDEKEESDKSESNTPVHVETALAGKTETVKNPVEASVKKEEKTEEVLEELETEEIEEVIETEETVAQEQAVAQEETEKTEKDAASFPVVPIIIVAIVIVVGIIVISKKRKDAE